jgi:EAL domain-containing protein (putative c-di-GMP-specific phosphodiesterase class I)
MPLSNLRFLIAEDHPMQRRVLAQLLSSLGAAAVHQAEDGAKALEILRDPARPVDIIVSDVSMPGMDGLELVRHMAASASPTALIITSALRPDVLASVANTAVAYGVRLLGVVGKPASAVKLVPLVKLFREMQARIDPTGASVAELAQALSRDEFEARYEPWADMETAQVKGFHARTYWRHPTQGLLAPDAFASSAESYGLLDSVMWLTLQQASHHWQGWSQQGCRPRLWLSLCPTSLLAPDLAKRILKLVRAAGIEPGRVVLGVTEAAIDGERAQTMETLSRLRVAGFKLGIEDFGSGPMWSEKLAPLSFTDLKISAELVRGARSTRSAEAGLVVALDAAQQLKLPATADGVDRLDEWNLLQDWGCKFAQGAFVGPTLHADEVVSWLAANSGKVPAMGAMGKALDVAAPQGGAAAG